MLNNELSDNGYDLAYLIAWVTTSKQFSPEARELSTLGFLWKGLGEKGKPRPERTAEGFWLAFGELFDAGMLDIDPLVNLRPREHSPAPQDAEKVGA